jgi:hypothetical protein
MSLSLRPTRGVQLILAAHILLPGQYSKPTTTRAVNASPRPYPFLHRRFPTRSTRHPTERSSRRNPFPTNYRPNLDSDNHGSLRTIALVLAVRPRTRPFQDHHDLHRRRRRRCFSIAHLRLTNQVGPSPARNQWYINCNCTNSRAEFQSSSRAHVGQPPSRPSPPARPGAELAVTSVAKAAQPQPLPITKLKFKPTKKVKGKEPSRAGSGSGSAVNVNGSTTIPAAGRIDEKLDELDVDVDVDVKPTLEELEQSHAQDQVRSFVDDLSRLEGTSAFV